MEGLDIDVFFIYSTYSCVFVSANEGGRLENGFLEWIVLEDFNDVSPLVSLVSWRNADLLVINNYKEEKKDNKSNESDFGFGFLSCFIIIIIFLNIKFSKFNMVSKATKHHAVEGRGI